MLKLDAYKLKWIAIIAMFFNHAVIALWDLFPHATRFPLYAVGGITFPVMAYFVVEGYKHTRSLGRYVLRILIVGLIALPFHILALGVPLGGGNPFLYPWLNIMFAIALSIGVLVMYDKIKYRAIFWILFVLIIVPVSFLFFEYYFAGVLMVLLFHIIKNETARRIVPPVVNAVLFTVLALMAGSMPVPEGTEGLIVNPDLAPVMLTFGIGSLIAAYLLAGYNGQRGRKMKWLFYVFYPLHFVVLAGIALALGYIDLSVFGM